MRLNAVAPFAGAILIAAFAGVSAAAAAETKTAATTEAAAAGAAAKPAKPEERKICRRMTETASRMKSERLCMTKKEWKRYEEDMK